MFAGPSPAGRLEVCSPRVLECTGAGTAKICHVIVYCTFSQELTLSAVGVNGQGQQMVRTDRWEESWERGGKSGVIILRSCRVGDLQCNVPQSSGVLVCHIRLHIKKTLREHSSAILEITNGMSHLPIFLLKPHPLLWSPAYDMMEEKNRYFNLWPRCINLFPCFTLIIAMI